VHGTGVYSAGVGPNGPTLDKFSYIEKKKKVSSHYLQCFGHLFLCKYTTLCRVELSSKLLHFEDY
jgi:hypothetical protein